MCCYSCQAGLQLWHNNEEALACLSSAQLYWCSTAQEDAQLLLVAQIRWFVSVVYLLVQCTTYFSVISLNNTHRYDLFVEYIDRVMNAILLNGTSSQSAGLCFTLGNLAITAQKNIHSHPTWESIRYVLTT